MNTQHSNDEMYICPDCRTEMLAWQKGDHRCAVAIASTFVALLREELDEEEFEEMCHKNRDYPAPGVCASHDYCDANMVMLEAFEHHGANDDPVALWGQVWELAMPEITAPSDEEMCDRVAAQLRDRGISAHTEYMAGGIFCVCLPTMDGGDWILGMANTYWGGEYRDLDGEIDERFTVTTDVRSTALDAAKVANAINRTLTPFERGAAFRVIDEVK